MARKTSVAPVSPPTDEARAALFACIAGSPEPIDAKKLAKALPAPLRMTDADLRETLERQVADGRLFGYPPKTAAGGLRYWDRDTSRLIREALLAGLSAFESPLAAAQVIKGTQWPFKASPAEMVAALDSLVDSGHLHRHPPATSAGKPRYATHSVNEFRRAALLTEIARTGPLPETKLKGLVKGISSDEFRDLLATLFQERRLFAHPPLSRTGKTLYGGRPPAPENYLTDIEVSLRQSVTRLREAGVDPDELRRAVVGVIERAGVALGVSRATAATTTPIPDLLDLLRELDPVAERGGLVGTRDLRRAAERLASTRLDKRAFDEAVLALSRQGRLSLHRHDHASALSEKERDELVTDGAGNHYVGVAIRQPVA
jgi:hypothetical protein